MKIAAYMPRGAQSHQAGIGAIIGEEIIDLNYAYALYLRQVEGEVRAYELAHGRIPRDMIGFLQGEEKAINAARRTIEFVKEEKETNIKGISGERLSYALADVKLLAPISRPGKILAAGKNYADHAKEAAAAVAKETELRTFPGGFVKVSSVVIGPDDPVELAHVTQMLAYEGELAIVIGKRGRYIPKEKVYEYIAGYTIINDVSARDIQRAESKFGNHLLGKNLDTLCPMGPWIVLKDEVPDPMNLRLQLKVNGQLRQDSNTSNMIFGIPEIIERWSWVTLEPGDVIATGTPAGAAVGAKDPYLQVGDVMECTIERLGSLRNAVVAEKG
jgi:acylpyruvate hydrolase